jgi:hypothetical protein
MLQKSKPFEAKKSSGESLRQRQKSLLLMGEGMGVGAGFMLARWRG